jgi:hypothetical protein
MRGDVRVAGKAKGSERSARASEARQRKAELDAERAKTEARIEGALDEFAAATDALAGLEAQRERHEAARAASLRTMRECGRTAEDVAYMTGVSVREVRKLSRTPGEANGASGGDATESGGGGSEREDTASEATRAESGAAESGAATGVGSSGAGVCGAAPSGMDGERYAGSAASEAATGDGAPAGGAPAPSAR